MQITSTQHEQVTVVALNGSIDAASAREITEHLTSQINSGNVRLVLDLAQVAFMSSAGLRTILTAIKECRQHGGDLRVAAARGEVERTLNLSGFTSILSLFPTAAEALAGFNA